MTGARVFGVFLVSWLLATLSAAERRLHVLTSFLPAYCFAANIIGDAGTVENLLPGTVNLHDYQLTPADLRKVSKADLIVVNDLGLEGFLDRIIASSGPVSTAKVVRLSSGLEASYIRDESGKGAATLNPHIWLDPRLAQACVTNLLAAFEARDPQNAVLFRKNSEAYLNRLAKLDSELEEGLAPFREEPLVTFHNAFAYFVRRYKLNLVGVVEKVPEVAPTAKERSALLAIIRQEKVKALFAEPGQTRLVEQIARDAGISVAELDPLETGNLQADTYEVVMKRNMETLRKVFHR